MGKIFEVFVLETMGGKRFNRGPDFHLHKSKAFNSLTLMLMQGFNEADSLIP